MASLSVKDRLAALKAKLGQNATTSTVGQHSTNVSPPPPPPSASTQQPAAAAAPAAVSTSSTITNDNNTHTNCVSSNLDLSPPPRDEDDSSKMIHPTFIRRNFPPHIYFGIPSSSSCVSSSTNNSNDDNNINTNNIANSNQTANSARAAAINLAQVQYLSTLVNRSDARTTAEGVRPSARSFVDELVATVTASASLSSSPSLSSSSSNRESGQRRQRRFFSDLDDGEGKKGLTAGNQSSNNNNNNNISTNHFLADLASSSLSSSSPSSFQPLQSSASRQQKKQDIAFLGAAPSQRKCEDVVEKYDTGTAISEGVFGVVYRGTAKTTGQPFALKKIKDNWFTESREGFPHYLLRELDLCLRLKSDFTMEGVEIASNRPTEKEYACGPQLSTAPTSNTTSNTNNNNNNNTSTAPANQDSVSISSSSSSSCMKSLFVGELCSQVAPPTPGVRPSLFLVTEYGGRNLRHEIMRLARPFDIPAVKHIMTQILHGMNYLHKNFIVHRDLKPSNILVNDAGTVKICDFGLARSVKAVNNTSRRQLSTNVVTLFYRAPELHFGAPDYNSAIDVWSIGCIFAELLTGAPLFVAHEDDLHLQEVVRLIGVPTEESFPGFTLFPRALKALSTVTVRAGDVQAVVQHQQQHKADDAITGVVRSPILERHIKTERAKLFSADEAGERLQRDPRYAVTESCLELLDWMLQWSPKVRVTCDEALRHPFLTSESPVAAAFDIEQRRQVSRYLHEQQQQQQPQKQQVV